MFAWNPPRAISPVTVKKKKKNVIREERARIPCRYLNKGGCDSYILCRGEYCKHSGVVLFDREGTALP